MIMTLKNIGGTKSGADENKSLTLLLYIIKGKLSNSKVRIETLINPSSNGFN